MGADPSPFGVDAEPVSALVEGLIEAGVDWRGLHIFAAAQSLDDNALIQAHQAIIDCAGDIVQTLGIPLPELNLGGGFDVPVFPGEKAIDVYRMATALHDSICNGPELLATTRLSLELGRWLVAESGVYLSRVLERTESCGETFLTTDGGGHHLLNATGCLAERSRGNYPIAVATRFSAPAEEQVSVAGCLATPNDVFGDEVMFPAQSPAT